VTLFGESAGGHDIKQLLANPPSPLPFRAAILQSPNQAGTTTSLASYTLVLAHFGCAAAPSPLACIRRVPATDLQAYVSSTGLGFSEVVGDGTSVGKQSLPSLASGTFARVPVMIGSNANEFTVFLDVAGLNANPWAFLNATLAQRGIPPSIINSSLISRFYASTADDEPSLVAQ
jgi:carboxylesterase type B